MADLTELELSTVLDALAVAVIWAADRPSAAASFNRLRHRLRALPTKAEPPPRVRVDLGPRLKAARVASGLTQLQAAAWLNVAKATLGNWETGRYPTPPELLERLETRAAAPQAVPASDTPNLTAD